VVTRRSSGTSHHQTNRGQKPVKSESLDSARRSSQEPSGETKSQHPPQYTNPPTEEVQVVPSALVVPLPESASLVDGRDNITSTLDLVRILEAKPAKRLAEVQGYLAHKKTHPPRTMVGL